MVLSRREKTIAVVASAALLLLALDQWVLGPLVGQREQAANTVLSLRRQVNKDKDLVKRADQAKARWQQMLDAGLKSDPTEAESLSLHALRDRAEECGVALTLLKPERLTPADKKARMVEIVVQVAGTGKLEGIAKLLYRLQTAPSPVKVTELQINSRKEGVDDLTFQLRLSTVYLAKARAVRGAASSAASQAAGSR